MELRSDSLRPLLALTLCGVLLRLAFVLWVAGSELSGDEGVYVYLALAWKHYGFYGETVRFLWPPGYPWLLRVAIELFGTGSLLAVQLLQVLGSASTGLSTMLLARRVFGARAAWRAGVLWCVYLPLIAFTGSFWTESLFLALLTPAILLAVGALQGDGSPRRTLAAALCTAAALYLKESLLYFTPVLAGCFAFGAASRRQGLGRSLFFLLVVAACLAPWQRHCRHVYGRFVAVGSTVGENAFLGLNAFYQNFDYAPLTVVRENAGLTPLRGLEQRWVERAPAPDWERAEELYNLPERQAEHLHRGLTLAREHPGWFLRSRLRKLADFVTPLSFFLRDLALDVNASGSHYQGTGPRLLAVLAMASPPALMLLALVGLCLTRCDRRVRGFLVLWLGYFALTALLVSMSRFRAPILPALLVLGAGAWAGPLRTDLCARLLALAGALLLGLAWWLIWPETWAVFGMVWEATG